jgi:hypothetical protein
MHVILELPPNPHLCANEFDGILIVGILVLIESIGILVNLVNLMDNIKIKFL